MTLWVIGTSVSVPRSGWTGRLGSAVDERIVNLSVGDQVSIMGLARLSQVIEQVMPGDVVLWEYPLLDILMEPSYGRADILHAMKQAWRMARAQGAHVILVLFTPKRDLAHPSEFETQIKDAATQMAVPIVDLRDRFDSPATAAEHYRDVRHLRADSPLIDAMTEAVVGEIAASRSAGPPLPIPASGRNWRWWPPEALDAKELRLRKTSLLSVNVARLGLGAAGLRLPPHRRLVSAVIVSEHGSGALWCGHSHCAPASCRLLEHLAYPFLLRSTRLPCVRGAIEALSAAPRYALAHGAWFDRGLAPLADPAPVELVGLLLEEE